MQKKDVIELTIGYHKLEGKVVQLKKPLAMLEKEPLEKSPGPHAIAYHVSNSRGLISK